MDRVGTSASRPILIKLRQSDNTRTGAQCMGEFEGSQAECQAQKAFMIAQGASDTRLEDTGNGYWRIEANFPFGFNGQTTDFPAVPSIHEMEVNTLQTSIYRSLTVRSLLTPSQIGIVQRYVTDYQSGLWQPNDTQTAKQRVEADLKAKIAQDGAVHGFASGRTSTKAQADATSLFDLVAFEGQEDFIEYTNIYRRTLTAADPQQVIATFTGVGQIWTTPEVQTFEGLNPGGFFLLDPTSQWLKSRPQIIAIAGQKTQIVYSYTECHKASGMTYTAYKSATLLYPPA